MGKMLNFSRVVPTSVVNSTFCVSMLCGTYETQKLGLYCIPIIKSVAQEQTIFHRSGKILRPLLAPLAGPRDDKSILTPTGSGKLDIDIMVVGRIEVYRTP